MVAFMLILVMVLLICVIGTIEKTNEALRLIVNRQNEIIKQLKNSK